MGQSSTQLPYVWWADAARLCSSAIKGLTSSKKWNLKAPAMLNLIRKWQSSAPSCRKWRQTSSSACTGKCVVPFSEEQKFTATCGAWEACMLEGRRHHDVRYGEWWSALSWVFFLFPFCTLLFLCLAKGGQVLQLSPPFGVFFGIALIDHCASNKAIKSATRSSLCSLCDGNRCSRGLLNLGLDGLKTLPSYSLLIQVSWGIKMSGGWTRAFSGASQLAAAAKAIAVNA